MSGLIWAGIGQGIANAGRTAGDYMMRSELEEERQRERAELQRERIAAQERQDALYRRTADQQTAGRSGGGDGGLTAKDIGEGGADEGMLARRAGMTVPELRAMRKYSETGDSTPFQVDTNKITMKDTGDPYNPETESQIVKELPPGFEREARAKLQALAKIEESYRMGGKYDDVTKGRRNQQEIDMSDAAIRQPGSAGVISQGMAAGEGKPIVDVKDGTAFNQYTGTMQTTDKGKSEIRENDAQAGKARAEGKPDINGVAANAANLIKLADKAAEDGDNATAKRLRDEAARLSLDAGSKKVPKAEGGDKAPPAPDLSKVAGVPKNATLGSYVQGKGWEVMVDGKLKGHVPVGSAGSAPPPPAAKAKGDAAPAPAPEPPVAPRDADMVGMSVGTLRRIAGTDGHARQSAAKAELARREAEAQAWDEEAQANRGMMP